MTHGGASSVVNDVTASHGQLGTVDTENTVSVQQTPQVVWALSQPSAFQLPILSLQLIYASWQHHGVSLKYSCVSLPLPHAILIAAEIQVEPRSPEHIAGN